MQRFRAYNAPLSQTGRVPGAARWIAESSVTVAFVSGELPLADAGSVTAMRKLVAWMLVTVVLSLSAIAVARAQDRGAKPNAAARAANAPPLVPVRLNMEGNFRIAPPYAVDPAF